MKSLLLFFSAMLTAGAVSANCVISTNDICVTQEMIDQCGGQVVVTNGTFACGTRRNQESSAGTISGGILRGDTDVSNRSMSGGIIQGDAYMNPRSTFEMSGGIIQGTLICNGGRLIQTGGIIQGGTERCR